MMNKRDFLPMLSFLVLGLSGSVGAQEQASIKDTDMMSPQVAEAVKRLSNAGIVTGYLDGSFLPNRALTRGDLMWMLARLWEKTHQFSPTARNSKMSVLLSVFSPNEGGQAELAGIKNDSWYHLEEKIVQLGLTKGYPDGYYRKSRHATRVEAATVLARLAERKTDPLPLEIKHIRFADVGGDEWYFGSVLIAAGTGLMQGYPDRTFRPHRTVTRGEFAVALARLLPDNK